MDAAAEFANPALLAYARVAAIAVLDAPAILLWGDANPVKTPTVAIQVQIAAADMHALPKAIV